MQIVFFNLRDFRVRHRQLCNAVDTVEVLHPAPINRHLFQRFINTPRQRLGSFSDVHQKFNGDHLVVRIALLPVRVPGRELGCWSCWLYRNGNFSNRPSVGHAREVSTPPLLYLPDSGADVARGFILRIPPWCWHTRARGSGQGDCCTRIPPLTSIGAATPHSAGPRPPTDVPTGVGLFGSSKALLNGKLEARRRRASGCGRRRARGCCVNCCRDQGRCCHCWWWGKAFGQVG